MKKLNSFLDGFKHKNKGGFTLIEILVVIGIIAVLAAIVIIAINPARQFAQARNTQRTSNVSTILNAIGQNMADNKGIFICGDTLPSSPTEISDSGFDIYNCIVPTYIASLSFDPGNSSVPIAADAQVTSSSNYETGYTVDTDSTGRVTVCAPGGVEPSISGSTAICLTR